MKALCHTLPLYRGGVIGCNTSLQEDRPNTCSRVGHKVCCQAGCQAHEPGETSLGEEHAKGDRATTQAGIAFHFNDRRNDFRRWPLGGRAFPTHTAIDAYTAPKLGETA